jgi:hypothetical protein
MQTFPGPPPQRFALDSPTPMPMTYPVLNIVPAYRETTNAVPAYLPAYKSIKALIFIE